MTTPLHIYGLRQARRILADVKKDYFRKGERSAYATGARDAFHSVETALKAEIASLEKQAREEQPCQPVT